TKAEEQLELVLKSDPNNAVACNDLGYLWADQNKNLDRAEELIRKAITIDRRQHRTFSPVAAGKQDGPAKDIDHAAYVDSLGWVLFRRGKVDEARHELERATALPDGEDPVIWEHLGDVYHHLRDAARARTAWEHARQLYQQGQRKSEERARDLERKLQTLDRP